MKKTVHYLGYYVAEAQRDKLTVFPSCFSKIEYVADKLEQIGMQVRLVSAASVCKGHLFFGKKVNVTEKRTIRYLSSFRAAGALARKLNVVWLRFQLLLYILFFVKKQDVFLVYHSLFYAPVLKFATKYFKKKFILEIEDVYSSVTESAKKFKKQEWDFFKYAESYLCVNDILADKLPKEKKKVISYGNYSTYPKLAEPDGDCIRLVYAGVIEQKREAAFLAIDCLEYLDNNYRLDIMGFGEAEDIEYMQWKMKKINDKKGFECVRYLGMLTGDLYYAALQQGNVALSTHRYSDYNMESADNTFPSKMLVYLANDLMIVAQRLDCLQTSMLNPHLYFYDNPEPDEIARAVQAACSAEKKSGVQLIRMLDITFTEQLGALLEDKR